MTSWSKVFGVLLTVTVAAIGGCGEPAKSPADSKSGEGGGEGHAEVGKPAPDLAIDTLNDKGKIDLSGMQGKIVVVDFWATWCGPCKQSFPKLEALSKKVSDKVVFVGVSVDDEKKGIVEFAKENGASFAIGWDEGHKIADRWKVGTMPTTFIVDATGKVRHIHDGYHDDEAEKMEKELNALVSEAGSGGSSDGEKAKSEEKTEKTEDKAEKTEKAAEDPPPEDKPPPTKKKKGGKKGGKKPKKSKS